MKEEEALGIIRLLVLHSANIVSRERNSGGRRKSC